MFKMRAWLFSRMICAFTIIKGACLTSIILLPYVDPSVSALGRGSDPPLRGICVCSRVLRSLVCTCSSICVLKSRVWAWRTVNQQDDTQCRAGRDELAGRLTSTLPLSHYQCWVSRTRPYPQPFCSMFVFGHYHRSAHQTRVLNLEGRITVWPKGLSTRGGKLHNWWFQQFFPQALLATSVLSDAAFVSLDWLLESFKAIKRSDCWVESGCRMLSIAQLEVEMSTKRFWWRRRGGIVVCMRASDISNNLWEVTVI